MSFKEEVQVATTDLARKPTCSVYKWLEEQTDDTKKEFREVMADLSIQTVVINSVMAEKYGWTAVPQTLARHRNQQCACNRQKATR
jgi:hypothetical protein